MSENSKIEWTDHTFNIVWGCSKVSEGCAHCYAESFSKRTGHSIWGPGTQRRVFGAKHWEEPLKWNKAASAELSRQRVFCSSMADVFEDHPTVNAERAKLWSLIDSTPYLVWLLLTKRPENIGRMMPNTVRPNVWLGTTAENQQRYNERVDMLLETPATRHFVSAEPLLGPIRMHYGERPHWLIVGGESGPKARAMDPAWIRSLRDQCDSRTAFFFKQWGGARKKAAGRVLDGREWNEMPAYKAPKFS